MLELSEHLRRSLPNGEAFEYIMQLDGDVYRQHKNRRTICADIGGREYFVKIHGPSGWGEIFKNVLAGRVPVLTAEAERRGIEALEQLGIPTTRMIGYGCRGRNPARRESFIITEPLTGMIPLAQLAMQMRDLPDRRQFLLKRTAIEQIARIARRLHTNGINHRDFYLAHFLVTDRDWHTWTPADALDMHVIDLHRMEIRRRTPTRWVVKDLAGLLFSSLDAPLTTRDVLRFVRVYFDRPLREVVGQTTRWRRAILKRAVRQYRAQHGRRPRLPAGFPSCA